MGVPEPVVDGSDGSGVMVGVPAAGVPDVMVGVPVAGVPNVVVGGPGGGGGGRGPAAAPLPAPELLRPTLPGNVLAAVESRAGEPYGLDAVVAWPRLYPLLGEGVKAVVDDRRAGRGDDAGALPPSAGARRREPGVAAGCPGFT